MSWETVPLESVATLNPRADSMTERATFLGMAELGEDGRTTHGTPIEPGDLKAGYTPFRNSDILFAKITPCFENGKIGQATIGTKLGWGSTEFHVVRPDEGLIDARFLHHYLRTAHVRAVGEVRMTGSAGQRRVPLDFLRTLAVPLPPLPEQRRIAAILDEADALREVARAAVATTETLTGATFDSMFGTPTTWDSEPLGGIVRFCSGGTPSKSAPELWDGDVPWFSPKDMKSESLYDSIDHVAPAATGSGGLKLLPPDTVTIVVRGMILAHTLPVTRLRVPATINQDVKALLPSRKVDPAFLASAIRAQSAQILGEVATAGHGTKRLDTSALHAIPIPRAAYGDQIVFRSAVDAAEVRRSLAVRRLGEINTLFASLQHRAFRGEL